MIKPQLSVVIATYNPIPEILNWALRSLAHQTLAHDRFEVIIVDNGSGTPVEDLAGIRDHRLVLRVVQEPRNGTAYARCRGILVAQADLIAFLDDDNYIDPDYLSTALDIADREPGIGAFGGIAHMLTDTSQPEWKKQLFIYVAVRNFGSETITSSENCWGEWEPIGAGMVFRRDVGLAYVNLVESNPLAARLGRSSTSNICGEDSLLARTGYQLGYSCSYQPSLSLTHFIRSSRLTARNLFRTIEGIGRSYVLFEMLLSGRTLRDEGVAAMGRTLLLNARHRVQSRGWKAGLIETAWDVGYLLEIRRCAKQGLLTR
jgi:glycosyltransferase involved in cell wall biosynthesis